MPEGSTPPHDTPGDEAYYSRTRALLERAYLEAGDTCGGSGFRGDAARWERARRPIASVIDRDGTFLDAGCANGLLMESIAALARRRLPWWSGRIFVGNLMDREPPIRFDFVRAELEYVPRNRRQEMVERLLRDYLVPGGRLIACSYGSASRPEPTAEPVGGIPRDWGHEVAGESEATDTDGAVITRVAWADAPHPPNP